MDTDDLEYTLSDALDKLDDNSGQTYLGTDTAWELLLPFSSHVIGEFILEYTHFDESDIGEDYQGEPVNEELGALALSGALEDVQRSSDEARSITNAAPHQMLVTYSDVSAILVEALGGEPSDYTAGGAGFTSDGRHDSNVPAIEELVGDAPEP